MIKAPALPMLVPLEETELVNEATSTSSEIEIRIGEAVIAIGTKASTHQSSGFFAFFSAALQSLLTSPVMLSSREHGVSQGPTHYWSSLRARTGYCADSTDAVNCPDMVRCCMHFARERLIDTWEVTLWSML